jgi:N-acetylmuramoyl-L-alanine amidase
MHSFHSNAIAETNSPAKLESTDGFMVFTTKGNTLSDEIATQHFKHVQANVLDWNLRTERIDGDNDFEANFQVIRETDLKEFNKFGAILDEWGFHTSGKDCEKIMSTRTQRVKACLETAKWVKSKLQ